MSGHASAYNGGMSEPGGKLRARVSLCVIARDEAHQLTDCLAPLTGLFHEIIVVDTGSRDGTGEVAQRCGARVIQHAWRDSFSAARNAGIDAATGEWIFWLDADDRLDRDALVKLGALFASLDERLAVYLLPCRSARAGRVSLLVDHARLFPRRDEIRFAHRVHEQVMPSARRAGCELRRADIVIEHLGYRDEATHRAKAARNLRLLRLEIDERPDDPLLLFYIGWRHQQAQELPTAIDYLRRAVAAPRPSPDGDPPEHFLTYLLAHSLQQVGDIDGAFAVCKPALDHHPEDLDLLLLGAALNTQRQDLATAVVLLRRMLALPARATFAQADGTLRRCLARQLLAAILLASGGEAEALALWRASKLERPDFAPAWLAELDHLAQTGGRVALLERYRSLAGETGPDEDTRALLEASLLMHLGDPVQARVKLEGFVALHPGSQSACELLKRLPRPAPGNGQKREDATPASALDADSAGST